MDSLSNRFEEIEKASVFCADLAALVKTLEMYPESHPRAVTNSEKCVSALMSLLGWKKDVSIFIDDDATLLNNDPVPDALLRKYPGFQRLQPLLRNKNIVSIHVEQSTGEKDLIEFAKILTTAAASPFKKQDVAMVLQEKGVFSIRVNEAPGAVSFDSQGSLLLTHFLEGSLGTTLSEDLKERLFDEIKLYSRSTGRQVFEQLNQESAHSHPIVIRDILPTLGEKWMHFTGGIITDILGEDAILQFDPKVAELLNVFINAIERIPSSRKGKKIDPLIKKITAADDMEKIRLFQAYYEEMKEEIQARQDIYKRTQTIVTEIIEKGNTAAFNPDNILKDIEEILPELQNYPSLNEKLFSAIYRVSAPGFILKFLQAALNSYMNIEDSNPEMVTAFKSRLVSFCSIDSGKCSLMLIPILDGFFYAKSELVSSGLYDVIQQLIEHQSQKFGDIVDMSLVDRAVELIQERNEKLDRRLKVIDLWCKMSKAILNFSVKIFRQQIVPLSEYPLSPETIDDKEVATALADAWKSFSETAVFQDIFKKLTDNDRDTRFKTIKELSRYGAFAAWVCLGGLNSQNWHLRRNLATVLGKVTDLTHIHILKEPLRDHDWHVRLEILSALAERTSEIADKIKSDPNHPIVRIFSMALRDGNPTIRKVAYQPIEEYKLLPALRSLKDIYARLAAVNSDADLDERVRIIHLMAHLATAPDAPVLQIIDYISRIAAQKEGIITPQWMLPIKKAAVNALAKIDHPKAREWLETLATKRPYKRGVAGKYARAVLK